MSTHRIKLLPAVILLHLSLSDFNHFINTTKKWRFAPYVLVDKSVEGAERDDVLRLAMVEWIVTRAVTGVSD